MLQRTVVKHVIPVLLAAAGAVVCAQAAGPHAFDALAYRRDAVLAGQGWRLLTGPWVHLSWAHAALNLGGLALVLAMFAPVVSPLRQGAHLPLIGIATCALLLISPNIDWMAGLSGPLHGLFAANALALATQPDPHPERAWWRGPRYGWLLLAGLGLKLVLEQLWHAPQPAGPPGWLGGPVLIQAHWAGSAAGLIVFAVRRTLSMQRAVATQPEGAERQ